MENTHSHLDWAKDKNFIVRHILDTCVESGKKGYTCIGCGQQMIAKKGAIKRHHFAHDAKDVLNKGQCTFSNETYRHKVGKDILQRIKKIKVPILYKFPPINIDGKPNKIRDSEFIHAAKVENELEFYETSDGEIKWGRGINFQDETVCHLMKPDVTFFDSHDKPILLIELVATHKIDDKKLFKIRSLGINTIQVKIPKGPPEDIENVFFKTNDTEWVYNYEQENRRYIYIPSGGSQAISTIDEFQRRLLESIKSYECTATQLRNLIRAVTKCLETEQYRTIKKAIDEELQRIKSDTEEYSVRWREVQEHRIREVESELRVETTKCETEEADIRIQEVQFSKEIEELERRYISKKEQLDEASRLYGASCEDEIRRIENEIERIGGKRGIEDRIEEIRERRRTIEANIIINRRKGQYIEEEIDRIEQQRRRISNNLIEKSKEFNRNRDSKSREFEKFRSEIINEFEGEANISTSPIGQRIKAIINGGELLSIILSKRRDYEKLGIARTYIKEETYRYWL